jgi:uncharacterized protein YkwD
MLNVSRSQHGRVPAVLLGVVALVAAMALLSHGGRAAALTNCTVTDTFDSEEAQFLTLINNYRAQNGRSALTVSTNLNRAAAWMVVDMATKNYFAHTDSLGRAPSQRATDCGYPGGAGENLAAGTNRSTAQTAFDAWKNSAGHNANMLNASYRQIGIARYWTGSSTYGWYWATDFGLVNDGTSGGGGGGGGGGATPTPTPTPTPPPAATAKAAITSPAPGSTLTGASTTFAWSAGTGVLEYFFYAGTAAGSNNLFASSMALNRSATVNRLPTNGSTVYVRLWSRFATGWQYNDYTYRAAAGGGAVTPTPTPPPSSTQAKAAMSTPTPGSTLAGSSATFTWTAGSGALEYFFYAGTTAGGNNLFGRSMALTRSAAVTGLPTNGSTVYVRLWTRFANGWQYNDYTYRAASAGTSTPPAGTTAAKASMTRPAPGSALTGRTVNFNWTAGTGSTYLLQVGTTAGGSNLYSRVTASRSATVMTLPANGSTIYVRLWTLLGSSWQYVDYTYTSR